MTQAIETRVKTYKTQEEFNKDVQRMMKDGWSYDPQQVRPGAQQTEVVTYTDSGDFNKEAQRRAKDGWSVANTVNNQPRPGCLRILLTGGLAFIFRPKSQTIVTYTRAEQVVTYTRART